LIYRDFLVGFTGFVGQNLNSRHKFSGLFNSKNISEAFGEKPNLLVYAGVPSEKYSANNLPARDLENINQAFSNILKIAPKKLILISTIDVYSNPVDVNEDVEPFSTTTTTHAYGANRYYLEQWVSKNIRNYHIVRLPALFGEGIKKNFIYDLIKVVPMLLSAEKYQEISRRSAFIKVSYQLQENGFYKLNVSDIPTLKKLQQEFLNIDFSALNFTDSRAIFQFYNLKNLWTDLEKIIEQRIGLLNLAVEPLSAQEIYQAIFKKKFVNEMENPVPQYNFKTKHLSVLRNSYDTHGYLYRKEEILKELVEFVEKNKS